MNSSLRTRQPSNILRENFLSLSMPSGWRPRWSTTRCHSLCVTSSVDLFVSFCFQLPLTPSPSPFPPPSTTLYLYFLCTFSLSSLFLLFTPFIVPFFPSLPFFLHCVYLSLHVVIFLFSISFLSIFMSGCGNICLYNCLPVCLPICLSVLSIRTPVYASVYLFSCLMVSRFLFISICMSLSQSIYIISLYLIFLVSIYNFICLFFCLSISVYLSFSPRHTGIGGGGASVGRGCGGAQS